MKIVFRVDASREVGFGHLSRCINLAEVLRIRGNEVLFICREDESKSFKVLEDRLFKTCILPRNTASSQISQEADADETIGALDGLRPSWLVVDSYKLDDKFEQKLRGYVEKIAVIEDRADRRHDCDLLIDQNYSDRTVETFKRQVRDTCKFLIGPKYAMLNSVFAKIREVSMAPRNELKRVFVFCGGSDPNNLTKTVIDALGGDEFSEIKIDVVIGSQNQNFKAELTNPHKSNIEFHESGDNYAKIMSSADLAIGAGGTTIWERMCLGLPSIVVSIADNQVPACEKLGREGLVRYLGPQSEVTTELVTGAVSEFLKTPSTLSAVSLKSQIFVDGKGCERVAEVMCPSGESDLKVRLAKSDDCVQFFNWANDPVVREQSLNTAEIQWIDHQKWFGEKIKSDSTEIYVLEASGLPVGQVRFDLIEDFAEIDYSLDEIIRGRGWSPTLLEKSIEGFRRRRATSLNAVVECASDPSRAVFFMIGFKKSESHTAPATPQLSIAFISDENSWFNRYLSNLKFDLLTAGHRILHAHRSEDLISADFCFYLSFSRIVSQTVLSKFSNNLVVHESDLPHGRGWSPLTWQILEGKKEIAIVLFEASEHVDSGPIYVKKYMRFKGDELVDQLRDIQAAATIELCREFIEDYPVLLSGVVKQKTDGTFYEKRTPLDSQLDPVKSLLEQFNSLRVADNLNYPAYFEIDGNFYELWVTKKVD